MFPPLGQGTPYLVVKVKFYIHPTYTVTYTIYSIDLERVIIKVYVVYVNIEKNNNNVRFSNHLKTTWYNYIHHRGTENTENLMSRNRKALWPLCL
jgi:hypothetical protein